MSTYNNDPQQDDDAGAEWHIGNIAGSIDHLATTDPDAALAELLRIIEAGGLSKRKVIENILWHGAKRLTAAFEVGALEEKSEDVEEGQDE